MNFPSVGSGELKGILRDRTIALLQFYREKYIENKLPDGAVTLIEQGEPLTTEAIVLTGTDVEAVRKGYISIGKVKSVVM